MMTIGDREERIFLSHPYTNNGYFYRSPLKRSFILERIEKKDFQKIPNTLKCDMVTSFNITMTSLVDMRPAEAVSFLSSPNAGTGV